MTIVITDTFARSNSAGLDDTESPAYTWEQYGNLIAGGGARFGTDGDQVIYSWDGAPYTTGANTANNYPTALLVGGLPSILGDPLDIAIVPKVIVGGPPLANAYFSGLYIVFWALSSTDFWTLQVDWDIDGVAYFEILYNTGGGGTLTYSTTGTFVDGDELGLHIESDELTILKNGSAVGSWTYDFSHSRGTGLGFQSYPGGWGPELGADPFGPSVTDTPNSVQLGTSWSATVEEEPSTPIQTGVRGFVAMV